METQIPADLLSETINHIDLTCRCSSHGKPSLSVGIQARRYLCRSRDCSWIRKWPNCTLIQADPDSVAHRGMDETCCIHACITPLSEFQHFQRKPFYETPRDGSSFTRSHDEFERSQCNPNPDPWGDLGPVSVGIDGDAGVECFEDFRCCLNRYK